MITVDRRSLTLVERRDGFDYAQPRPYGAKGTSTSYEMLQPFGLVGRPRGPSDGNGANGLVLMEGSQGFVIATTDPRYQAQTPDLGDGGAGLYATAEISGSVATPFLGFYGKGGDKDEGTLRAEVPTAAGITTIEVDATTGDVTIQHAAGGGAVMVVKAASVELGAESGGMPLVKETPLMAWITTLISALASAPGGPITVSPPAGIGTTKVNAT